MKYGRIGDMGELGLMTQLGTAVGTATPDDPTGPSVLDTATDVGGSLVDAIAPFFTGNGDTPPNTAPAAGGTPGAVAYRPGNWDMGRGEYVIAQGDTMVGISALYLGNGARWQEIRQLQTHSDGSMGPNGPYLNANTSVWFPGSTATGSVFREGAVLVMPKEAVDMAAALAKNGTPKAPPTPGAPATKPAADRPRTADAAPAIPTWAKVAGVGVVGYLAYKFVF